MKAVGKVRGRSAFVCAECGYASPKWIGRCPSCAEWNSLVEEAVLSSPAPGRTPFQAEPVRFDALDAGTIPRLGTGIPEFDRVLGGGIVQGALTLLGGDPGVGKSTLMLDVASRLSKRAPVLYASGEESPLQISLRGQRMQIDVGDLHVYAEMSSEKILQAAEKLNARTLIVDSVQTTFSERLDMAPGSVGQVREVTSQFLSWSKKKNVPVFLIGHITKDGSLAGPKALEHIVDTVLYFEGPRQHPHRIVRSIKNRFGAANELGIFEMTVTGLRPVEAASRIFLSGAEGLEPGSAVVCSVEGSRPLLVEIQALVSRSHLGTPRRLPTGVDPQRLALVVAVIEKRLGVRLWDQDIYLNVVGGLEIGEPAADLGIGAAILSSFLNRPVPGSTVLFGEVGLGGEVRSSFDPGIRLKEARSLGFTRAIVPKLDVPGLTHTPVRKGLKVSEVNNLSEAIEALFGPLSDISNL